MSSTPLKEQDAEKARELAKPIYDVIDRLGKQPTADELSKIQQLIDQGADLEVRYNSGNRETVLYIALCRHYFEAAELLIRNGADVNARCVQECTPYIFAAIQGNLPIIKTMYEFGRPPLHPDDDSYIVNDENITALISAARFGRRDVAEFLIDKGADMNVKNGLGMSAADYAREAGHFSLIEDMERATRARKEQMTAAGMTDGVREDAVNLMKNLRFKRSNQNRPE